MAAKFSRLCTPSTSLKASSLSLYSKLLVNQWPTIARIDKWLWLVHTSRDKAIVEHVLASSSSKFCFFKVYSEWSSRTKVLLDSMGSCTPGISSKICRNSTFSIVEKLWWSATIHLKMFCFNFSCKDSCDVWTTIFQASEWGPAPQRR